MKYDTEVERLKKFAENVAKHIIINDNDPAEIIQKKFDILKEIKDTHGMELFEISEHYRPKRPSKLMIDDERDLDACPVCCEHYQSVARCPRSERYCKNSHTWHICTVHKKKVVGHSNNSIPMFECSCVL